MKTTPEQKKAVLMLADGSRFEGMAIGKIGTTGGEICFNTGMTGYQEIYTDPSYYGQIVINTNSHIGNYGILDSETESKDVKIRGLVVRNFSDTYSRNTAQKSLQNYLEKANIIGIANIDTRRLVRHIRNTGAINAVISSEYLDDESLKKAVAKIPNMEGLELASKVSTKEIYYQGDEKNAKFRVAVIDIGVKNSILSNFVDRGCYCKVFPARTTYQEIKKWNPDGFFISNGPGDPAPMDYAIQTVKEILADNQPLFGICLGHQVLALSMGISTYKMHHGHRGLNHPVKNLETNTCEITSQNHGFAISRQDVENNEKVIETHVNLNDQTIAGIRIKGKKAFSVQHHPEASPGPHDSRYLFDKFIALMEEG